MIDFMLNGKAVSVTSEESTPLLWVIRDELKLKGTKFGCGVAACGACTVHLDGMAQPSCIIPVAAVAGRQVTTIEGLLSPKGELHPLQQAWIDHQTPQCGYCQTGQIMTAAALLAQNATPTRDEIKSAMNGNICRCGTYDKILDSIESVVKKA